MKALQVVWNGEKLCKIYPYARWYQVIAYKIAKFFNSLIIKIVKFLKKLAIVVAVIAFIVGGVYGIWKSGQLSTEAQVTYASVEVIKEVPVINSPVLDRIAKCESGNTQFDKNGQVLMRSNKNGTVDVGTYQINSTWFKKATDLGLDITKAADNRKMAEWIYTNRGTEDWYPSKACWSK